MIGLLYRLIIGRFSSCQHKWEIHDTTRIVIENNVAVGTKYHLRCEHCGDMKKVEL